MQEKSIKIKQLAKKVGFDDVGIVKADFLKEQENYVRNWLNNSYNAEMDYMANNFEKRLNPSLLVEGAKSVIIVLKNYLPENRQINNTYKISKYAYSTDYHQVIKRKLSELFDLINNEIEPVSGRFFVDSAPVLERALAQKAGLGWIGKNSLLLTKKGSFFFIGELIIDLELNYDYTQISSYCGTCTKCIDACPTRAIIEPNVVDARKCISYQTIENKNNIDISLKGKFNDYIFGCDICQDVCPWNNKSETNNEFNGSDFLLKMTKNDWKNLTKEKFDTIFNKSAVKRTKYSGLMRNINFVSNT